MRSDPCIEMYERQRPNQERFTIKVESLLRELLLAKSISFHAIESRTKSIDSFKEKSARTGKSYTDPILDVTDLIGVRLIAYYQDDVEKIGQMISEEFLVDETNSFIHQPAGAEFGYKSTHYVVKLSEQRQSLSEWSAFAGLRAELQVRTVLQHAWAAVSHKLQYKREADVPVPLKRQLFRLAALFELADDEFISLRKKSESIYESVKSQIASGNKNLPIDMSSITELFQSSEAVRRLRVYAQEAGFEEMQMDSEWPVGLFGDSSSFVASSTSSENSDLIDLCNRLGLSTFQQLESALESALPWAKDYLTSQYNAENGQRANWFASMSFICELILIGCFVDNLNSEDQLSSKWNPRLAKRILSVARDRRTCS